MELSMEELSNCVGGMVDRTFGAKVPPPSDVYAEDSVGNDKPLPSPWDCLMCMPIKSREMK